MNQSKNKATIEDDRTGESVATLIRAIADNMFYVQGKFAATATKMMITWQLPIRSGIVCCDAGLIPPKLI